MRPVAKDDLCNDAVTLKQEVVIALSHLLLKLSAPFLFKGSQVLQLSSGKGEQLVLAKISIFKRHPRNWGLFTPSLLRLVQRYFL